MITQHPGSNNHHSNHTSHPVPKSALVQQQQQPQSHADSNHQNTSANAHIHQEPGITGINQQSQLQQQQQQHQQQQQQQMQQAHNMTQHIATNLPQGHLTMSVHSATPQIGDVCSSPQSVCSPQVMSPSILVHPGMISSSCSSPQPSSLSPQINSANYAHINTNCSNGLFFQSLPLQENPAQQPHQVRLQHTHSLQANHSNQQHDQQQKLLHQQSLPERTYFPPSAITYANAHLLNTKGGIVMDKSKNTMGQSQQNNMGAINDHLNGQPAQQKSFKQNPQHQHQFQRLSHHQSHPQQNSLRRQDSSQSRKDHQHSTYHQHHPSNNHRHHINAKETPLNNHGHHSGSRSSLLSGMGPGSTQTLPHPRHSTHAKQSSLPPVGNTATLGRRGSLYIVRYFCFNKVSLSRKFKLYVYEKMINNYSFCREDPMWKSSFAAYYKLTFDLILIIVMPVIRFIYCKIAIDIYNY